MRTGKDRPAGRVKDGMHPSPFTIISRYLDAARRGDWDAAYGFYADGMRFRIPGRSAFSGEHEGRSAAIAYVEHARALSKEHEVEVELIDILTGHDRVALLVRERFHRHGETVEIRRANVYRVHEGQIVEIWIFEADQDLVDALFAEPVGAGSRS